MWDIWCYPSPIDINLLIRRVLHCCWVTKSYLTGDYIDSFRQASLSMGFPRQEYWSRLPFPSPGDLPNQSINWASPALVDRFFNTEPPGKPNKGLCSQSYGFSCSHVWMWELDYKESWASKNWCFCTVALEKTLESALDCKEIQPGLKEICPGCSLEGLMFTYLWRIHFDIWQN